MARNPSGLRLSCTNGWSHALRAFAREVARAVARVFACVWRLTRDADVHALVADLSARAGATGVAREEAHAREAGLICGAVAIERALEVGVGRTERIFTNVPADALGVSLAGFGATSVEA